MIAIVADSTACIPCEETSRLGILVAPINWMAGGQAFQEGCLDRNGDYERLIAGSPGKAFTSHTSVAQFAELFRQLTRSGNEALCLTLSSRLSGTYLSALSAARETDPERITVIDSLSTAGGLTLLAREAAALRDGGATLKQAALALNDLRNRVGVAFSVGDMGALRRSGRLGAVRLSVGTMLNVRPVLALEQGAVVSKGVSRGRIQTLRAIADLIPGQARSVIVHAHGPGEDPEALLRLVRQSHPAADLSAAGISPSLRIHLGSGVIGAAWLSG